MSTEDASKIAEFFPSDLELEQQQPYSSSDASFSFPLSFVLFVVTYAAVFFSLWRISPALALIVALFSSPVWLRSLWVFELSHSLARPLTLREKMETVMSSIGMVASASACFVITFAVILGLFIFGSIGIGALIHGDSGVSEGAILGTIAGFLIGVAGAIFITAWIFQRLWPSHIRDKIGRRGKST